MSRDERLLLQALQAANEEGKLEEFLKIILTHDERLDLAKRCRVLKELLRGAHSHREISTLFKVSVYKVSRGVHALREAKQAKLNINHYLKEEE